MYCSTAHTGDKGRHTLALTHNTSLLYTKSNNTFSLWGSSSCSLGDCVSSCRKTVKVCSRPVALYRPDESFWAWRCWMEAKNNHQAGSWCEWLTIKENTPQTDNWRSWNTIQMIFFFLRERDLSYIQQVIRNHSTLWFCADASYLVSSVRWRERFTVESSEGLPCAVLMCWSITFYCRRI